MPQVLTTNALILCPHGGKGITTPTDPKWRVNGGTVALEGDPGVIPTCPFLPLPCVGYTLRSMGLNATQVDRRKVILVTDFNQTVTGLPLVMTEFHQTYDNSTPAPIPAGQSASPLPGELVDFLSPVVTSPLATIPVKLTPTPPPLAVAFNLAAQHPLMWVLTYINEPQAKNLDLTTHPPPAGMTVAPSGRDWSSAVLTVTVTMTPAFLASLAPGKHHLFLTGVSKRGLSGHADVTLEVTP